MVVSDGEDKEELSSKPSNAQSSILSSEGTKKGPISLALGGLRGL